MINVFDSYSRTYGTSEDFFTASLAMFIEGFPEFREAFVRWLEPHAPLPLAGRSWSVRAQAKRPSRFGEAYLDLVLASSDVELWLEHKTGAALGTYKTEDGEEVDQLEKYLDAARTATGIPMDEGDAVPPVGEDGTGRPHVLLYCIARDAKGLEKSRYGEQNLAKPGRPFGLVWVSDEEAGRDDGHLRWRDFWPRAKAALDSTCRGEHGEFARTLAKQFLAYWGSLPGMSKPSGINGEWSALFERQDDGSGNLVLADLWDQTRAIARRLGWSDTMQDSKGLGRYFGVPQGRGFDQVTVGAVADPSTDYGQLPGGRTESIVISFRTGEKTPAAEDLDGKLVGGEPWGGRIVRKDGKHVHVVVALPNWPSELPKEAGQEWLAAAFVAGLRMFVAKTGMRIDGLDRVWARYATQAAETQA